ncbi:glycosyltransferase family 39 protein [Fervidibacillus albus]|uniref:Glycosyltransferase family 39 protein n=1 Tax=Fervidibacillus albus TaxID=2980026 RepID=A0A9E8RX66_9BACI|nr:glycosyltransferase family 39 protein [Fervidibacillus albus]WAA09212.1 glycosyltransferase family 39 protein [Fervidibacillus albus]
MIRKVIKKIDLLLVGIIALSVFFNFYFLQHAGSNEYYKVAVKSMLTSFHNFFYASFDPGGFITVDKPPVALWIQAMSAYIFGLSDLSVIFPEALAGVISVWMMYHLVKPKFGRIAGLLSSLVLACSPIFVAVVRTNNVDSILILTLLMATWALMKSVERKKLNWFLLSVALVGVGFNIKMLQAYMVLPAFYLFYFLAMKGSWIKKLNQLIFASVVLILISLSWALVVEFTPENDRPYIGGSETNSAIELAFGYNGIERLTGPTNGSSRNLQTGMTQGRGMIGGDATGIRDDSQQNGSPNDRTTDQRMQMQQPSQSFLSSNSRGGTGDTFGTGSPGVLRLFSKELSGQISFLIPFTFIGFIPFIQPLLRRKNWTNQHLFALFWLAWLIPMMIFFSIAQFFHQYYLSMMGPAIAALTGIGWTVLWTRFKENNGWESKLLPFAIFVTFLFEGLIIYQNREYVSLNWMFGAIGAGIFFFVMLLVMKKKEKWAYYLSITAILSLLVIPSYWTWITIHKEGNSNTPIAGPSIEMMNRGMSSMGNIGFGDGNNSSIVSRNQNVPNDRTGSMDDNVPRTDENSENGNTNLLTYLEENFDEEKWFLAVPSARDAYSFMLNTDYAVMAMGGFKGTDPALTPEKLEELAENGEVKFFLISSEGQSFQNEPVITWIMENCEVVPDSEWSDTSINDDNSRQMDSETLYMYKK